MVPDLLHKHCPQKELCVEGLLHCILYTSLTHSICGALISAETHHVRDHKYIGINSHVLRFYGIFVATFLGVTVEMHPRHLWACITILVDEDLRYKIVPFTSVWGSRSCLGSCVECWGVEWWECPWRLWAGSALWRWCYLF